MVVEAITGQGGLWLRRATVDLSLGDWLNDPAAKTYAGPRPRGKRGGNHLGIKAWRQASVPAIKVLSQARCQRPGPQSATSDVRDLWPSMSREVARDLTV